MQVAQTICFLPLLLWAAGRKPLCEGELYPSRSLPRGRREESKPSVGTIAGSGESWSCEPDRTPSCTQPSLPLCHPRTSNKVLIKGFSLLWGGQRGIQGN